MHHVWSPFHYRFRVIFAIFLCAGAGACPMLNIGDDGMPGILGIFGMLGIAGCCGA